MSTSTNRVRFAPSPTGLMHLGNIRTALMNYLFAKNTGGTFVLRIEDTDPERNFDPGAKKIMEDLQWLSLHFDEGPNVGGEYAPYFQSERAELYTQKLHDLQEKKIAYRCFCTTQELDKKRQRQIAMKRPPRYDRTCEKRSEADTQKLLDANTPHIWRMKLDHNATITINDLARKNITFELKNFSDFPLTRQNGTVTFMFANFVDDLLMGMTHVFRGEDHLTNTAGQAALYQAFDAPQPTYWHMPILCNLDGKKLSKRDFGFSLTDLKNAGYLPQALCNYLGIIGGGAFTQEIMPLDELARTLDFNNVSTTGQVRYDVEKLTWVNHKWIQRIEPAQLTAQCLPFLQDAYDQVATMDADTLTSLLQTIKTDLNTLKDCVDALRFYFTTPDVDRELIMQHVPEEHHAAVTAIVRDSLELLADPDAFTTAIKKNARAQDIKLRSMFAFVRLALTGKPNGPGLNELISMLGTQEARARIEKHV